MITSYLHELRAERRADRVAAAALEQDVADRREARRRATQAHLAQLAATRRQERRNTLTAVRDRIPDAANAALWATVIVLPITLAWAAQAAFAATALHIPVPLNHAFPASIETGAWVVLFEAHRRTSERKSTGSLTTWAWVLAGVAAAINAAHGLQDNGPAAAFALGALSLLGIGLHSIRQGLNSAEVAGRRPGLALWRHLRYPRLSLAAASIRAARELDHDTAWELAWVDRYGVGPESSRRDRRLARAIVRREESEDRKAAAGGELVIIGGRVQPSLAPEVRQLIDTRTVRYTLPPSLLDVPNPAPTTVTVPEVPEPEPHADNTETPAEQAPVVLSARATALLPSLQAAITRGELPENPGVKRISAYVRDVLDEGLGVPVAQELRDALATPDPGLRSVS
ncbi:hypothetical protein [Amycolatopsis sp. NPDC058986]|uniref:hypothetical protein n=1 Tax=unclassified Amycolatopsis TaxID=2618356 RepID=UPI00366E9DE1